MPAGDLKQLPVTAARIDKTRALDRLRTLTRDKLTALTDSQKMAHAGAIHEETRQEDPKDTRAIEAQYLARGLAERVEVLEDTLTALQALRPRAFTEESPIALTAIVAIETLQEDPADRALKTSAESVPTFYFLVPVAGGERIELDDATIHCITPGSPLGQEIVGRYLDDEVELELPGGLRKALIVDLA